MLVVLISAISGTWKVNRIMNEKVTHFKKRYTEITNRFEILDLEKQIMEFLVSEESKILLEEEMDCLDELLIKVMTKKEYFHSGLVPCRFRHQVNEIQR